MRTTVLFMLTVTILSTTGCFQPASQRLMGRWIGRPDTEQAWASRRAAANPTVRASSSPDSPAATSPALRTDWEQFDFSVVLEFLDRGRLRLTKSGEGETVEGTWRVAKASGNRITVQFETDPESAVAAARRGPRQFVVRFEGRASDQFTLQEDGADPLLGQLFFERENR